MKDKMTKKKVIYSTPYTSSYDEDCKRAKEKDFVKMTKKPKPNKAQERAMKMFYIMKQVKSMKLGVEVVLPDVVFNLIYETALDEGFSEGLKANKQKAFDEGFSEALQKVEQIDCMINAKRCVDCDEKWQKLKEARK